MSPHAMRLMAIQLRQTADALDAMAAAVSTAEELLPFSDDTIHSLNLSVRARKCLARLRISRVSDLVQTSAVRLSDAPNCGATTINEIRMALKRIGLSLHGETAEQP